MSTSDYDVMQKKDDDTPVVWKNFEGLHTDLVRVCWRVLL
jgi:hypothetical protein